MKKKTSQIYKNNTLLDELYESEYLNNKNRPLNHRLISIFPSLYILFNRKNNNIKTALKNIRGYKSIKKNHLMDIGYYLKNNDDVRIAGLDPIIHYIYQGADEGRKPNPGFDGDYYSKRYPDVRNSQLKPLVHYSLYGKNEGRKTIEDKNKKKELTKSLEKSNPKVSIITASYNYADLIENGINSVINQTYKNWELIIVDDGSTDNSLEVIKKYTQNPKISLYQHENGKNKGLKQTILLGLKYCTGKYINFLEAEDWLESKYLEEKIEILKKYPDAKFIFNDVSMFSDQENFDLKWYNSYLNSQRTIIRNEKMPCNCEKYFAKHNFIPTFSCVFVEKNILLSCDFNTPVDPTLDFWIFKQLASKTAFYYINKKLTHWMMHKDSYINNIFSPTGDFNGFELEDTDKIIIKKSKKANERNYVNILYNNNPNINSNKYVPKSNRHFQREEDDVKLITFYLPQFHSIKENDEWWGKGFTEWTNVTKAQPQFIDHYQPHLPDELGFYDLSDENILEKQVELATKYGIYGFCFHYYWFSGKRLLEKPLSNFLKRKDLDMNFMLCWANESWTKAWTCLEGEILITQHFEKEDYQKFIEDLIPFFKDDRYIKINNQPVLIVYRPHFFSKEQLTDAIKVWREYIKTQGFDDLYILNTRTGGFEDDPRNWGIDATLEFPPNDMVKVPHKENLTILNPNFDGDIFDLPESIEKTLNLPDVDYKLYKTVFPSWDNVARKNEKGSVFHDPHPEIYRKWLLDCIRYTKQNFDKQDQFVFINAWNEWAEGTHLEPDRKYGFAYLESTLDALEQSKKYLVKGKNNLTRKFSDNQIEDILGGLNTSRKISIIIPIFNTYEHFNLCIRSVIEKTKINHDIILIDDASTDKRIVELLDELEKLPNIKVIRNNKNRGFVNNINVGIQNSKGDIILLNSDTIVTDRWIQKLIVSAYSNENIGTVTPFSNAAGVFSVPKIGVDNEIPEKLNIDSMAKLIENVSNLYYPEVPTGDGFCMFIKRDTINDVGLFDEENFGKGYGEENDFSMRAIENSWKNVLDDSTYIYHARSASFSNEKAALIEKNSLTVNRKYPEYEELVQKFVKSTIFEDLRWSIQAELRNLPIEFVKNKKRILFVIFEGGGTPQSNDDLIKYLQKDYECYLLVSDSTKIILTKFSNDGFIDLESYKLKKKWNTRTTHSSEYKNIYFNVLVNYKIDLVHIRHLLKHTFDLPGLCDKLGLPVIFSFHDFYICPSIHLIKDNVYCGISCINHDIKCIEWIDFWREEVLEMFKHCNVFVTTSESAKNTYLTVYDELKNADFEVIEHGRDFPIFENKEEFSAIPEKDKPIKIVIPGHIVSHKGANFIKELKSYDKENILEIHFFGTISEELENLGYYHGTYLREELFDRIKKIKPSFIGIFSIVPETFSHTLSEAWACGVPVLASDMGALKGRIDKNGGGWYFDIDNPQKVYDEIIRICNDENEYLKVKEQTIGIKIDSISEMGEKYKRLYNNELLFRIDNQKNNKN